MSFPTVIDNTIRKAFVTCETMAMYRHVMNLRPTDEKIVDLHFGKCFATGVEFARKAFYVDKLLFPQQAIEFGVKVALREWGNFVAPDKSTKTREALIQSLEYYFQQWPLGEDGLTPMPNGIECSFSIPLPILHPDTGAPLHYAGRYDLKAIDAKRRIHLVDEKTTSKFTDSWLDQWDLDAQMTGYIWSVRHEYEQQIISGTGEVKEMPEIVADIRGISVLKYGNGHVDIPITRSAWMIDRWYEQMLRDVRRMVEAYLTGEWNLALHGNACVQYGRKCDYHMLCLTPNPESRIEGNYKTVVWNPLERGK